jgi:hypothetical protein
MTSLKLFSLTNGSITLSTFTATYFVVVYHLLLVVECKEVGVAIIGYAIMIAIAITSKYL